jgi:hypothetical protein
MDFLRSYQLEITLGVVLIVIIEFLVLMSLSSRLARQSKTLRSLFSGPEGSDLEAILRRCQSQSEAAMERGDELETRIDDMAQQMRGCIQHFGLVRYDGFSDVSGQQSFSLAMLDANKNGAVVTGLFSRSDSRCYGKAIISGAPEQTLSEEEQSALDIALSDGFSAPIAAQSATAKRRPMRREKKSDAA